MEISLSERESTYIYSIACSRVCELSYTFSHHEQGPPPTERSRMCSGPGPTWVIQASLMWLKCWKQRNKLSLSCGTYDSYRVREDYHSQIWNVRVQVTKAQLKHDLAKFEVVNMNQTMCRFHMVPRHTNEIGTWTVRIAHKQANKKGFTVGKSCLPLSSSTNADGELGLWVCTQLMITSNIWVKVTQNGWMTTSLYHWWLHDSLLNHRQDL